MPLNVFTAFTKERQNGILNDHISDEVSAAAPCRSLPQGVSEKTHIGSP